MMVYEVYKFKVNLGYTVNVSLKKANTKPTATWKKFSQLL